jgi:gamma-glutamyltranspeptidase
MAAIATPHGLASEAGMRAMQAGGSAVDAALAAAAVLTVVYPHNCALGGDLFALVREPDGKAVVINASGPAPAGVDVARMRAAGRLPSFGVGAVTVPGLVAGWGALHERAGRLTWAATLQDAIVLARDGFTVTERLAASIADAPGVVDDPGMREVFAETHTGDTLRQPALAGTLSALADGGAREFYEGALAQRFAAGLAALGSAITAADLAAFRPVAEPPLRARVDGVELLTARPNSSGVLLAQALLALRAARLRDPLGSDAGVLAAIFAAGNAQRERELADPEGADPDDGAWIGDEVIARIAREATRGAIDPPPPSSHPDGDTVAIVATDDEGRAVSLIQSLYSWFGAQVLEPSTGVLLQNRGRGFSLDPQHPNVIAPGKRPAHTLMPLLVERDGALLGVLGAMGGSIQPQIHTQLLLRLLGGLAPAEVVAAPRFGVAAMDAGESPLTVRVEEDCDEAVIGALRAAGMAPRVIPPLSEDLGHAQVIWCDSTLQAGSDPRADGTALVREPARLHIRPGRPDEAAALQGLVERAYGQYVERIGRRPAPMDEDYAARITHGQVDVVVRGTQPVGLIVLVAQDDHLLIDNVAVDPDFQGQGAGRALLAHAERIAVDLGLPELRLYTNAAMTENLALYPSLGYRETGRRTEDGFQRVFFCKPLPSPP